MGKKWTDAKPAEKLLSLYTLLLFSHKEISLTELSVALDCSKQSVSRLITQLEGSRFGKVLRLSKGREVAFCLERPKSLPQISIGAEGLYQLALCREFLLQLLPTAMHQKMEASLRQASAFLPEEEQNIPFGFGGNLNRGHIDYAPFQNILDTMLQAIQKNIICSIRYKSSLHGEEKSFDYAPKRLLAFRESLLITGWIVSNNGQAAPKYKKPTRLSLQRITACVHGKNSSEHLPDISAPESTFFGIMDGDSFTATIRFSQDAATYVAERQWSKDQFIEHSHDGAIILHLRVQSILECLSWILSFGDAAEVLSPDWLRQAVYEKALGITRQHTC